jgi:hypothetical protein
LDAKAPGDAAAFKDGCVRSANTSPKQPRRGGILGIGGVTVSDAEKATLKEISSAPKLAA